MMSLFSVPRCQYFLGLLVMLEALLLASGCGPRRPPTATSEQTKSRMVVRLPITNARMDVLAFSDRVVSRSFIPRPHITAENRATIPDALWHDLKMLKQAWCTDPPSDVLGKPTNADYAVVIDCDLVSSYEPVFAVPPDRLPPALRELIQLVPPAPSDPWP